MDDAVALRVGQAREHSLQHAGDLSEVEAAHVLTQRARLEELHGEVRHALVLEILVHRHDVRVAERSGEVGLTEEALRPVGVVGMNPRELLQGHAAAQSLLAGKVDDGHSAPAQLAEHLVPFDCPQGLVHRPAPSSAGRILVPV